MIVIMTPLVSSVTIIVVSSSLIGPPNIVNLSFFVFKTWKVISRQTTITFIFNFFYFLTKFKVIERIGFNYIYNLFSFYPIYYWEQFSNFVYWFGISSEWFMLYEMIFKLCIWNEFGIIMFNYTYIYWIVLIRIDYYYD